MLAPAQWKQIVNKIRADQCVPFLGAAANVASVARNYKGLPLGNVLAKALAADVADKVVDDSNLPKVSLIYERAVRRGTLIEEVKKQIGEAGVPPSRLLEVLAALPFSLYITTNYDRLLERALDVAGRAPYIAVQTVDALEGNDDIDRWVDQHDRSLRPLVYKIHGTFKDVQPHDAFDRSPLIITEDDYIDFLTLLGSKETGIPTLIRSRLGTSTLLFLGYSLEDWDFRVIYKVAQKAVDDPKFQPQRYSVQKEVAAYWKKFWLQEGIEIVEGDIYEFADQLDAWWKKP